MALVLAVTFSSFRASVKEKKKKKKVLSVASKEKKGNIFSFVRE